MMKFSMLAAGAALVLQGCASAPEPAQMPDQLRSTHGFVRASLPPAGNVLPLVFRAMEGGSQYHLRYQPDMGRDNTGVWLPAGDYEIVDMVPASGGKYPPIHVERGRITDLGALVTLPLGGYEYATLAINHPEADAQLKAATDKLKPYLSQAEPLTWSTAAPPKASTLTSPSTGLGLIADLLIEYERHVNKPPLKQRLKDAKSADEMLRLALTAIPPQTDEPGVDADGALYYGGALGQVRKRAVDGTWSNLDTGTLQTITAVEADGKRLLAGTSAGKVCASEDGGRTWREVAALDALETIVDIDRVGERWIVIASRQVPHPQNAAIQLISQWKIYGALGADLAGLALLREATLSSPEMPTWGMAVRGQAVADAYFVNTFSDLLRLDLPTMQWSSVKPPQSAISRFTPSSDGHVFTAFQAQGAFSKLHLSLDQGKSWRPVDTPPYTVFDVHFQSADKGQASRISMGAFSSKYEFMTYDPSKDSWTKTFEAPEGCVRLLRDANNEQRFCLTSGGSILDHSRGKWVAEFAAN